MRILPGGAVARSLTAPLPTEQQGPAALPNLYVVVAELADRDLLLSQDTPVRADQYWRLCLPRRILQLHRTYLSATGEHAWAVMPARR